MHKTQGSNIESLLSELELAQPSAELDQAMMNLFRREPAQKKSTSPRTLTGVGWSLFGAGMAAAVIGLAIGLSGFYQSPRGNLIADGSLTPVSKEVSVFRKLHGHSANAGFQDCKQCHTFSSEDEQAINKWDYHMPAKAIKAMNVNCKMCHVEGKHDLDWKP